MDMIKVRSSRRAAGLKPGDYDHEIALVDHDASQRRAASPGDATMERVSTDSRRLSPVHEEVPPSPDGETDGEPRLQERPVDEMQQEQDMSQTALRPSIEVQEPTPDPFHSLINKPGPKKTHAERESAIDILYENERGGFLCGRALFASAALGGLDSTPWTNGYHKPSLTGIHTAQVPDPSWEWVWPEWHINIQDGVDDGGWEYAFAFSKKCSWHGPHWYNSFVRRRAWTRKRAKKDPEDISADPHMLNTDYFLVRSVTERGSRHSQQSLASSRMPSKASMSQASTVDTNQERPDIEDIDTLMETLRAARIDREKLEAAMNYLEHAYDLVNLDKEMHEIMSLFIFQASRRLLLSHLMDIYDGATDELEKTDTPEARARKKALQAAVHHADEEVRKLAYWSDIKQMAEGGESKGAADGDKGWHNGWQGIDQSGPAEPNQGKSPNEQ